MTSLRVGVIGLGLFGEAHLQAFQGIPGVEVVAVASRSGEHSRVIAARYDVPHAFDDYLALCQHPEVDAVTIATEESLHLAPAIAALKAGKHVFVEKPLADNRAGALAIRDAAQNASGRLMPGHIVRFEARFATLHDAIKSGSLGTIAALHASRNRPRTTLSTYGRCHPALITAIHDLDAMLWMMPELPTRVRAWQTLDTSENGIYGIWGTLSFPSGAIATIEATWMMPTDTGLDCGDTFSVVGTKGVANIDMGAAGFRILHSYRTMIPELGYGPTIHGVVGGALQAELSHFARIAKDPNLPAVASFDDGVRAVIAAEAMIESAIRNEEIVTPWPEDLIQSARRD
ncbi:MAG: Gfo/Idh/MocA family protein [Thermomicrobiales bacterium]